MRGRRPVATSTSAATTSPPPSRAIRTPSSSRSTAVTEVPVRTSTPASRSDAATRSPANGSIRSSSPCRASTVTRVPSAAYAVAISTPTTPPPMIASDSGTCWAPVASRLVHGCACASPGTGGTTGSLPVATTTACLARITRVPPSSSVTVTSRSPVIRPAPRASTMPAERSQSTWPSSDQSATTASRRASTAATSSAPVTACAAPATCCAERSACTGRSSAFDGMHAQ